jgi:hypothetical protein
MDNKCRWVVWGDADSQRQAFLEAFSGRSEVSHSTVLRKRVDIDKEESVLLELWSLPPEPDGFDPFMNDIQAVLFFPSANDDSTYSHPNHPHLRHFLFSSRTPTIPRHFILFSIPKNALTLFRFHCRVLFTARFQPFQEIVEKFHRMRNVQLFTVLISCMFLSSLPHPSHTLLLSLIETLHRGL